MMTYRNWKWLDSATEEQMDDSSNEAAVQRLADEARSLYDSIPEVRRRGDDDDDGGYSAEDAAWEDAVERLRDDFGDELTEEQMSEAEQRAGDFIKEAKSAERRAAFGQLDAIEQLMSARGARFARDYEHHNEDEQRIEWAENRSDY